ncbi:MAG: hypothetical protein HY043_13985 [Verrucomicrobia bacterium]|nr:hypothetical protein [Verrucomicrobiota bacterium]
MSAGYLGHCYVGGWVPMPKLSIITTILHPNQGLVDAIQSASEYPDSEHLISVAGDLDRARQILDHAGITTPILIAAPAAGIAEGFNACLRRASGDLIWVLNSGDRALNLNPLIERMDSDRTLDFVYGNVYYGDKLTRARGVLNRSSCLLHGMSFCHGAVIVRASFHEKFGLYDPSFRICMDADLFIAAILRGARSAHVDLPVAYIAPGGLSSDARARVWELRRSLSRHVREPVPTLLAAKWLMASFLVKWFSNRGQK